MENKIITAVEKCFDRCNLVGEDVDIYKEMNRYKALRELPYESREQIYEQIAKGLGFMED